MTPVWCEYGVPSVRVPSDRTEIRTAFTNLPGVPKALIRAAIMIRFEAIRKSHWIQIFLCVCVWGGGVKLKYITHKRLLKSSWC